MHSFNVTIDGESFSLSSYDHFRDYFGSNAERVETATRDWFFQNLTKEDTIFDIGANIGLFTVLFSKKAGKVYAFEPTDTYDNFLIPNLQKNGVSVNTHKLAFGDKAGKHEDRIFKVWGTPAEVSSYDFDTIDSFIESSGAIPTYLKIDVDSFEVEVLNGARRFLTEHSPTVVVEINEEALGMRGFRGSDILAIMSDLGYSEIGALDENHIFRKQ